MSNEIINGISLPEFKRDVRKEQMYYPLLKFKTLNEEVIIEYWKKGLTPIDLCNDLTTAT